MKHISGNLHFINLLVLLKMYSYVKYDHLKLIKCPQIPVPLFSASFTGSFIRIFRFGTDVMYVYSLGSE